MTIIQQLLSKRLGFMKFIPWKTTPTAMSRLYPTPVQRQVYLFPCSPALPEEEMLNN
jgi:hypothetical protein